MRLALCVICLLTFYSPKLSAQGTKGPYYHSWSGSLTDTKDGETDADRGKTKDTLEKTSINVPLPTGGLLDGQLVLRTGFQSYRTYYEGTDPLLSSDTAVEAMNLGLVYAMKEEEGKARPFFVVSRYDYPLWQSPVQPMSEYIVGASWKKSPFGFQLDGTRDHESLTLVRVRQYPGRQKYLLLVETGFKMGTNWSFEISIPSHLRISWDTEDYRWGAFAMLEGSSINFPTSTLHGPLWKTGTHLYGYLGLRRHLVSYLYGTIAAGLHSTSVTWYDEEGQEVDSYKTDFNQWMRLGVETWIP